MISFALRVPRAVYPVRSLAPPARVSQFTTLVSRHATLMNHSQQIQNEQDHEDCSKTAAGTVAPLGTVRPRGQRANKHEDQEDE